MLHHLLHDEWVADYESNNPLRAPPGSFRKISLSSKRMNSVKPDGPQAFSSANLPNSENVERVATIRQNKFIDTGAMKRSYK
jgi:hypothetical protein